MKRFIVFYAGKGSDFGYRSRSLSAEDILQAHEAAKQMLEGCCGKGLWEYILFEYKEGSKWSSYDTSFMLVKES